METPKQMALKAIQALADDCTWEKIRYRLYFLHHVSEGIRDADEGRLIPHEQVMRETEQWLLSHGQSLPEGISTSTLATSAETPSIER